MSRLEIIGYGRHVGLLFLFWILLSGHFTPLFFVLGLGSAFCVVVWCVVLVRLLPGGKQDSLSHLHIARTMRYFLWLGKEVVLANYALAKVILSRDLSVAPVLSPVQVSGLSNQAVAILSNSITLTPGTVTLFLREDEILVHGISVDTFNSIQQSKMPSRVGLLHDKNHSRTVLTEGKKS